MIFNIVTTGASNANDTMNERRYDAAVCPKNMMICVKDQRRVLQLHKFFQKILTIESTPMCIGASLFNAKTRITIGCTKYAQYVTRENG
jgi:hypothetical protein